MLRVTIEAAEQQGVERSEVERAAGLNSIDWNDADARVPVLAAIRLSRILRKRLGPGAAIQLGEAVALSNATVLDYLIANCATLGHAYAAIQRYRKAMMGLAPPQLSSDGALAEFSALYPLAAVLSAPDMIELMLVNWLTKGRRLTGEDWAPRKIYLQGPLTDREEYARVFRCPVVNNAEKTSIIFDSALLALPVLGADSMLLHYLQQSADAILAQLPARSDVGAEVLAAIMRNLSSGDVHLDRIAEALHVSPRTLQRRLEMEQTSFATLLDEARHVATLEYLRESRIAITDIAYLVGFSEPSTFYRAFKRWTGTTPASYRRSTRVN